VPNSLINPVTLEGRAQFLSLKPNNSAAHKDTAVSTIPLFPPSIPLQVVISPNKIKNRGLVNNSGRANQLGPVMNNLGVISNHKDFFSTKPLPYIPIEYGLTMTYPANYPQTELHKHSMKINGNSVMPREHYTVSTLEESEGQTLGEERMEVTRGIRSNRKRQRKSIELDRPRG